MLYFWIIALFSAPPDHLTLSFVGDLNFREYHDRAPFEAVRTALAEADLTVGNLEGVLLDEPVDAYQEARINITASSTNVPLLKDSGVDVFGLANNHTWDHGAPGLSEHLGHLHGFTTFGAGDTDDAARAPYRYMHNLGCVSIVPATLKSNKRPPKHAAVFAATYDRHDLAPLVARLRAEHARGCFVIAWVHGGKEGAPIPTKQTQADFHALAAASDLVIGHHPHVLQGVELAPDEAPIVYSLGNFLFINKKLDKRRSGILDVTLVVRDGHLALDTLTMRPMIIDASSYRPRPASAAEAADTTATLRARSAELGTDVSLVDGHLVFTRRVSP